MRWDAHSHVAAALVWLAASLGPSGCGGLRPAERRPASAAWSYDFAVDAGLTRLEAKVCFEGEAPAALLPLERSAVRYVRSADAVTGQGSEGGPPLIVGDRRIDTSALPPGACVRYVVDLDAAARQRGGLQGAYRIGGDLVASTAVWLWAPSDRAEDARVSARFDLPEGVSVSALWERLPDGRYRLDERAFRFVAYAAFGRFETQTLSVPGGCLDVSLLGGGVTMGRDALMECVRESAVATSMIFGRFPVPRAGVLAVPTPLSTSSPFGIVGRGSQPTVAILVGERATEERLLRAWVPVHEFSHLVTPYIDREDAWLSEGIATYYQEVLRARGGLIREREAWANLDDGFRRGARDGTGRELAEESRDMMQTAAFRRVYWAGAAIALLADVATRRRTNGRRSLDDALRDLNECCASWSEPMSGSEAIRRLDSQPPAVFGAIASRHLGSSAFPDVGAVYEWLGIERTDDGVVLSDDPIERARREAIMARPVDLRDPADCRRWSSSWGQAL